MIRTQQSDEQIEGFFKPISKVISTKQQINLNVQNTLNEDAKALIANNLPSNYKAKIINIFDILNKYPEIILKDQCQQLEQQLNFLINNKQKTSKKYLTLQQKYQNTQNYRLIYSKISKQKQFGSYIFSLDNYSQYNKINFIQAKEDQQQRQNNKAQVLNQNQFKFDSNFQSGNLLYVFENINEKQIPTFDLMMQNDTNTKGYNQWFYFSIFKNSIKNKTIKINIVNFIKKHLMFQDGVRPVAIFQNQNQWKFIGRQVQYKKSYTKRYIQSNGNLISKNYYTLSFILNFPQNFNNNKVYIALNYPYPYKRIINFIDKLIKENVKPKQINIKKQTLCYSISHNQVPFLRISSVITQIQIKKAKQSKLKQLKILQKNEQIQFNMEQIQNQIEKKKKKIIIFGRQHPGQTVGSFVLQQFLNKLLLTFNESNLSLIQEYSIYVFPMINVDGVIYGNHRTNLAGFDLNRQWIQPNKWLSPEIYYLKKFISNLLNISFLLDFHGHSRKLNSFIYACCNPIPNLIPNNEEQNNYPDISMFRLFPYAFSKASQFFSIKDCTYSVSRDKIKTARINTFKFLNYNPYIFTLQTGFFGYTKGNQSFRFKIKNFQEIGNGALESLKLVLLKPKKVRQLIKEIKAKDYLFDKWAFQNKQDPGSQSNPSQDQLNPVQIKNKVFSQRKMTQNQKFLKKIQKIRKKQVIKNKIKQKKNRKQKKQQNLKQKTQIFQRIDQIQKKQQKIKSINKEPIKFKSQKKDRPKIILNESFQNKKDDDYHNMIVIKQPKIKKTSNTMMPQIKFPQYVSNVNKKKEKLEQFKSSSNLLGTGISYLQSYNSPYLATQSLKYNIPTPIGNLQINNIKKQKRVQSFSSAFQYQNVSDQIKNTNNPSILQKPETNSLIFVNEKKNKILQNRQTHRQKLFIVRQNKIVKIIDSVNKTKKLINGTFFQAQLSQRRQTLKQCQQIMSNDNKCLIKEIKQLQSQDKKRKKVLLNPLTF